jgi:exo-beta-1,3-glucanase (GH17 family)
MKIFYLVTFLTAMSGVSAFWKGLGVASVNPAEKCRSMADWIKVFSAIASLPGNFTSARIALIAGCDTLPRAAAAALNTGLTLMPGLSTDTSDRFAKDKAELEAMLKQRSPAHEWLLAVTVEAPSGYDVNNATHTENLVQQIYDVRGMVHALGAPDITVSHADYWDSWLHPNSENLIRASDWVGMDYVPFNNGFEVHKASTTFFEALRDVRDKVFEIAPEKWVWVIQTGWPWAGDTYRSAVPSKGNAAVYWNLTACEVFREGHAFWHAFQDNSSGLDFSIVGQDLKPLYDLSCS